MLDHIGLQVQDVERSLDFYLRTFAPIGMRAAIRFPHGDTVVVGLAGPGHNVEAVYHGLPERPGERPAGVPA
jgi:catechol 2,3-dioxygenase-like lactoylglutathione lyase family enzyme